jgi:hypothetical protein
MSKFPVKFIVFFMYHTNHHPSPIYFFLLALDLLFEHFVFIKMLYMCPINLLLLLDWNLDNKNIKKKLGFSFHKVTSSKLKKKR